MSLCYSEGYRTLNDYDKNIADYCMDNKHPMIPSTFSCENHHQSEISSLLLTVTQMWNKVDSSNLLSDSLYRPFPALSTGIFNMHGSEAYKNSYIAKMLYLILYSGLRLDSGELLIKTLISLY